MPSYEELVAKYKKRRHDTVMDAVTTGLSMAENVSVDLGLLEDTGIVKEVLETVGGVLPFAVVAVTESCQVMLGKKTGVAGASDAAFRMLKTGAAMGVGAAAIAAGAGTVIALPAAITARVLMDRYRGKALTGHRVSLRTKRLRALREAREAHAPVEDVMPVEECDDAALLS